jgi:hypothetical protein
VRLLGLRLRAQSVERARRQWATLLGGEASVDNARHVFRWPGSPLRIAVDIDAAADEGPSGIEVVAARPVSGLGTPAPGLGTTFIAAGDAQDGQR